MQGRRSCIVVWDSLCVLFFAAAALSIVMACALMDTLKKVIHLFMYIFEYVNNFVVFVHVYIYMYTMITINQNHYVNNNDDHNYDTDTRRHICNM